MHLTPELVVKAIKEYWMYVFQKIWEQHNLFIPARFFIGNECKQWSWVSLILETDLSPVTVRQLPGWEDSFVRQAVEDAEITFVRLKRNRTPIQSPRTFNFRLRHVSHQLHSLLRNDLSEDLVMLNQEIVLGSRNENAIQAGERLGVFINGPSRAM